MWGWGVKAVSRTRLVLWFCGVIDDMELCHSIRAVSSLSSSRSLLCPWGNILRCWKDASWFPVLALHRSPLWFYDDSASGSLSVFYGWSSFSAEIPAASHRPPKNVSAQEPKKEKRFMRSNDCRKSEFNLTFHLLHLTGSKRNTLPYFLCCFFFMSP